MDTVLKSENNIFFTSDTHFGHKNICRGVTEWKNNIDRTRDFDNIEKMDEFILNQINSVVKEDDILIHLGDFSFGGHENIPKYRNRILCKNIILILGNHDDHIKKNKNNYQDLFTEVIVGNYFININNNNFILNHYPIVSWRDINKGVIHLHGHVHLRPQLKLNRGKALDVGVDGNNYKPYSYNEIIKIMDKQPIANFVLNDDHHLNK